MFGTVDLPQKLALRLPHSDDTANERSSHNVTQTDRLPVDGSQDFIDGLCAMHRRAKEQRPGPPLRTAPLYIIERNGSVIGHLCLDFAKSELRVIDLCFVPQWQGKGFGTTLLGAIQTVADALSLPVTLAGDLRRPNEISAYLALGFTTDSNKSPSSHRVWLTWYPPKRARPAHTGSLPPGPVRSSVKA